MASSIKKPSKKEIKALVSLFDKGSYLKALPYAQKMTRDFPKYGTGWKGLGAILRNLNRNEEALISMKKAVELLPADVENYINLGGTQRSLGKSADAELIYLKAIELNPNSHVAYNDLGTAQQDLGRFTEAESSYIKSIELAPIYPDAYSNLGNILKELGRFSEVEKFSLKAIELNPGYADAYNNLADYLYYSDSIEKAMEAYKNCMDLSPLKYGLKASVSMAILNFLYGNIEDSVINLELSSEIIKLSSVKEFENYAIYWQYLNLIHSWHKNNKLEIQNVKEMYVIGESHSLVMHGMNIRHVA